MRVSRTNAYGMTKAREVIQCIDIVFNKNRLECKYESDLGIVEMEKYKKHKQKNEILI